MDPLALWAIEISGEGAVSELDNLLHEVHNSLNKIDQSAVASFSHLDKACQQASMEMLAVEKNAKGVQAALELAGGKTKGFEDLHRLLLGIEKDFVAGRASAEVAQKAIATVVNLTTERVKQQAEQVRAAQQAQADAVKKAQEIMTAAAEKQRVWQMAIAGGFAYLQAKVIGYVQAGLQATAEGERLAFLFGRLNREIASVFTPAIHGAINALQRVVEWFRALDGTQQAAIRRATVLSAAFLGMTTILPRLIELTRTLSISMAGFFTGTGAIFGVVGAMASLALVTESGRAALARMGAALMPLGQALGTIFESLVPVAEALAPVFQVMADVIGFIAQALGRVIGFIGPIGVMVGLFYLLGTAAASAFGAVSGGASKANMDMALLATTTTATTGAFTTLGAAMKAAFMSNPLGLILGAAGGIIGLITAFSRKTPEPHMGRQEVTQRGGPFEDVAATWTRLQQSAGTSDAAQRTRERMAGTMELVERNTRPRLGAAAVGV